MYTHLIFLGLFFYWLLAPLDVLLCPDLSDRLLLLLMALELDSSDPFNMVSKVAMSFFLSFISTLACRISQASN